MSEKFIISIIGIFILMNQSHAQTYPIRPITLVVPFVAGGAFDVVARLTSEKLGNKLGQPVVVENKPGAGGTLGGRVVSRAKPDGYTLLLSGVGPISISPAVYKNLGYIPTDVLTPVIQLTSSPFVLVSSNEFNGSSVQDLVKMLKENPSKYSYASTGNGTLVHLAGEYFKNKTETNAQHIPYGGGSQATVSLLSGHTLYSITNIPNVKNHIDDGKLRAIATTGHTRSEALPNTPTMQESGLKGFELTGWIGIFAPTGTPENIINKLNAAYTQVMDDPKIREALRAQGDIVATDSVEKFKVFLGRSNDFWANVAKMAKVSLD